MDNAHSTQISWLDVARFDIEFKGLPCELLFRIFKDAFGDDYPEEVEPHSFLTKSDLARMVHFLAISPGGVLVDLGCGRGGPGLWLARETGADLIGIDLSPTALEQASQRISKFGLEGRARFLRGDLCATGLPDQSCDAAISIEVVMFYQDQTPIMREVARILRPGAPFVFTAFEGRDTEIYRLPLRENGFDIEVYEDKPDWLRRGLIFYEGIMAEKKALIEAMGEGARTLIAEAEACLAADGLVTGRHIIVVARRM